ncbi:MAG: hypothetical protein GQ546_05310 [Gammaproteobacteria bacterium]|nr:hypothetical protein [Gammaproteobacteria bacterium]
MKINKKILSQFLLIILLMLITLIPVSASENEKTIKIDPANVVGLVDMRTEITSMLEDLGYNWHPVFNESTQQFIKVAEKYDQYRMLFKLNTNNAIQINVHINQKDNVTGLHFFEMGNDHFNKEALKYFQLLKERSIQEFGDDSVSDGFSFFTP